MKHTCLGHTHVRFKSEYRLRYVRVFAALTEDARMNHYTLDEQVLMNKENLRKSLTKAALCTFHQAKPCELINNQPQMAIYKIAPIWERMTCRV